MSTTEQDTSTRERWQRAERILAAATERISLRSGIDYRSDTARTLQRRHEAGNHRAVREVTGIPRSQPAPALDTLTDEQRARAGERALELLREGSVQTTHDFGFCGTGVSSFLTAIGLPGLDRKTVMRTSVTIGAWFDAEYDRSTDGDGSAALQGRLDEVMPAIRAVLKGVDEHLANVQLSVSAYPERAYV